MPTVRRSRHCKKDSGRAWVSKNVGGNIRSGAEQDLPCSAGASGSRKVLAAISRPARVQGVSQMPPAMRVRASNTETAVLVAAPIRLTMLFTSREADLRGQQCLPLSSLPCLPQACCSGCPRPRLSSACQPTGPRKNRTLLKRNRQLKTIASFVARASGNRSEILV